MHPNLQLSNANAEFFCVNCTSKLQPCDLSMIQSFKVFYRKQLVWRAVADPKNRNLNDACKLKLNGLEVSILFPYCGEMLHNAALF